MSIRILTLINIGLFLVAQAFTLREPLAGITIKALTVIIDFVACAAILIQGEFSDFGFRETGDVDRDTDLLRYMAGLVWVLIMGLFFGGLSLIMNYQDNLAKIRDLF